MEIAMPQWQPFAKAWLIEGGADGIRSVLRPANDNYPPDPPPAASARAAAFRWLWGAKGAAY